MFIYRLLRGGNPKPGDAGDAAHVGDYETEDAARTAAALFAGDRLWIEPVEHDPDAGTYSNAGEIAELT